MTVEELDKQLIEIEGLKAFAMNSLKRMIEHFDIQKVDDIVKSVDKELLDFGSPNILPKERKDLVVKLLALRLEKLGEIYTHYK
jgi:hypothetical protein